MNNGFANRLLALMAKSDLQMINSHLESVQLTTGTCLEYPSKQIEKVYFPESGVLSVVAVGGTRQTEIGLIGREGVSGLSVILAEDRSPHACYVQVACRAYRLAARTLSTAMRDRQSLN